MYILRREMKVFAQFKNYYTYRINCMKCLRSLRINIFFRILLLGHELNLNRQGYFPYGFANG